MDQPSAEVKLSMPETAVAANAPVQGGCSHVGEQPTNNTITINSRVSDFWTGKPRLWFHQFEAIMAPQKAGDLHKYQIVIAKLGRDELGQISDILENPPEFNKYETLKSRLISAYEESETKQLQKLLTEIELGDQKPSQLLRKMRELGRKKVPEETIKILWIGRLPQTVRAVITACDSVDLDATAIIADKIMETTNSSAVFQVNSNIPSDRLEHQIHSLSLEIAALNKKISDLQVTHKASSQRESRRQSTGPNRSESRSRTPSRSRYLKHQEDYRRQTAKPGDSNFKCFYHYIFGDAALKCGDERCTKRALN